MVSSVVARMFIFSVFLLIISFVSIIVMRGFYGLYDRLETYHKLPKQYESGETAGEAGEGERTRYGEPFPIKLLNVFWYSFIGAFFSTAVLLVYLPVAASFGLGLSISSALGGVFIIVVMNFAIRVASFLRFKLPEDDSERESLRSDIHNFGFSFICSLYFLWVLGVGLALATGNVPTDLGIPEDINPNLGLMAIAAVILAPAIYAVLSETILYFVPPPGDDHTRM